MLLKFEVPRYCCAESKFVIDPSEPPKNSLEDDPRVLMTYDRGTDAVSINPTNLKDGQAEIVARRLAELITEASPIGDVSRRVTQPPPSRQ